MPEPTNRPLRVFLCHAKEDITAVRALSQSLKSASFSPWLDEEELVGGQDWDLEIRKAIRTSDAVFVCLSKESITKTGYVNKEIKEILDIADQQPEGAIFLIPLRLEDCQVPDRLSRWQWVDYFASNGFNSLVRSLSKRATALGLVPPLDDLISILDRIESGQHIDSDMDVLVRAIKQRRVTVATGHRAEAIGGDTTDSFIITGDDNILYAFKGPDKEIIQDIQEAIRQSDEINRLLKTMRDPVQPPTDRAIAGLTLAGRGDPRPEATTLDGMQFCYVPGGPFIMGEDQEQHTNTTVTDAYWLGRYPVTVAQFRAYLQGSGRLPKNQDSLKGPDNHPVRWVGWHEALAFCVWLGEQWRHEGLLPGKWDVHLPSEAQWEKAARGGLDIPAQPVVRPAQEKPWLAAAGTAPEKNPLPSRVYPWGDAPDPNRANCGDTGIGSPSAVGCFPGGASPYGVEELSGNVWEWTRSLYKYYPYTPQDGRENLQAPDFEGRVLRGGAFDGNERVVRCAYRFSYYPLFGYDYVGFRVAVSPSL